MFNKKILILSVVVLVFLLGGYLINQNFQETITKETFSENKLDEEVKIQADRDTYTPELSSTVGIGLTPIHTLDRHLETVKFHWHTNYGHFVSWEPPDYKINLLGTEVINNGEKIYWLYPSTEMDIKKPSVQISLSIEDAQSGQLLTMSSLKIDWEDEDIAKVKK